MKLGWALLALATASLLAGCGDDKTKAFASCRLDGLKAFGHMEDAGRSFSQQADMTMLCMEAKGFKMNWDRCPTNAVLTAAVQVTTEACYDSQAPFAR